jgi:aminomethyltransferase
MALNDRGGVEDDIIVWWLENDRLWVMPNGTNFDGIIDRFAGEVRAGTVVEPMRAQTALLAVQGPDAPAIIEAVLGSAPGRFRVGPVSFRGVEGWAAGTGYTGERGAEVAVPAESGAALFAAFVEEGATPCGLGARDTLRLEMGYPLWGQDLDASTTPLEAGLSWVVSWDHDFVGKAALERQREHGVERRLTGLRTEGRMIPRPGYRLRTASSLGTVTSGNFSPALGRGIGLGYLSPPVDGGAVEIEIRGDWVEAEAVSPPFIER